MKYRDFLPHLQGIPCLTDGGLETVLIFQQGIDLPGFASFTLLDQPDGPEILQNYFRPYAEIARCHEIGLLLESPTWRASEKWGRELGYSPTQIDHVNHRAIEVMRRVRDEHETLDSPMPISGCVGPRGDGYVPSEVQTAAEAEAYHLRQIRTLAQAGADQISALTLNYVDEAVGIVRAAEQCEIPVAIGFTIETNGRPPDGSELADAILRCDRETGGSAAYYMVNCAHATHFEPALDRAGGWRDRLRGFRGNASRLSHAELDEAEELDEGVPAEFEGDIQRLREQLPALSLFGGCCGTDHRHIAATARAVAPIGAESAFA